jgi:hypothetical protein
VAEIIEDSIGRAIQAMAFSGDADETPPAATFNASAREAPQNFTKQDPFDMSAGDSHRFPGAGFKLASLKRIFMIASFALSAIVLWWIIGGQRAGNVSASNESTLGRAPTSQVIIPKLPSKGIDITDLKHLRSLAQLGDAAAQFSLGVRYATGEEVKQDYSEAARWFSLAAEQGHVMAQSTLGAYYWAGRGLPQDLSKAYFWAVLANTGGDEASKVRLSFLASRLSRREILSVQQQASDWLKQHQLANTLVD